MKEGENEDGRQEEEQELEKTSKKSMARTEYRYRRCLPCNDRKPNPAHKGIWVVG